MNKTQLIEAVAAATGLSKKQSGEALTAVIEAVVKSVAKGNKVSLPGFGSFYRADRKATTGRNPATGAAIKIAAAKLPKFKAGKGFKDTVNKK